MVVAQDTQFLKMPLDTRKECVSYNVCATGLALDILMNKRILISDWWTQSALDIAELIKSLYVYSIQELL